MSLPENHRLPEPTDDTPGLNTQNQYKHSGKAPLTGLLLAFAIGSIVSAGAGVLYCFLVTNLAFSMLKILIVFGFAACIGTPIGWIAKSFKVRSERPVLLAALLAATIGLYFCWAFHPYFISAEEQRFVAWKPTQIYEWSLKLFNAGRDYRGWFAVFVWTLEAGTIYLLGFGSAVSWIEQPFCERCNCWTEKRMGVAYYHPPPAAHPITKQLLQNDARALLSCEPSDDQAESYLRVDMAMCPRCLQTSFISCRSIDQRNPQKKGHYSPVEKIIMDKVIIDPETLQSIIVAG
ncbi:MAG: hypothetical protein VX438_10515 [Planctomycetota bacterium]|nr:hypothetical protein [Planctomycetota bacterium]